MNIENAFCVEMDQIVDIYQARYFFEERQSKERLNFLCSSDDCKEKEVKVIGVNHDKSLEVTKTFVTPHFRKNSYYTHSRNCIWKIAEVETQVINNQGSSTGTVIGKRGKKLSQYVDVFSPKSNNRNSSEGRISVESVRRVNLISDIYERGRIIKDILRESPSKSTLLERVVNCYLIQSEADRGTKLLIEGNPHSTYREVFQHVRFSDVNESVDYIYYGGASVKTIHNVNYRLTFYDTETTTKKPITLYLTQNKLSKYKKNKILTSLLNKSADSKKFYVDCYFFGKIQLSEVNDKYINVKLDHLDNLVLKLKEKEQK